MDENEIRRIKLTNLQVLYEALYECVGEQAKGHGMFLYKHDDATHMAILTFNTDPDDIYSMIKHANAVIQSSVAEALADAPPKEMWN
jgi:hypothetical protein